MNISELAEKIGNILEVEGDSVENSDNLDEFENFDSFALIHISVMIESNFNISIEPEDFEVMISFKAIVGLIEERSK